MNVLMFGRYINELVLTYIESKDYKAKKNSFEVISYARALADQLSTV